MSDPGAYSPDTTDIGDVDVPTDFYGHPIATDRPLILVPGFMGSRLQLSQPSGVPLEVWPPIGYGRRGAPMSTLAGNDELIAPGLIEGFYTPLIDFLHSIGYQDNVNFWQFAYDWTRKNADSAQDLIKLIEHILGGHPEWRTIDIVCHSMGGLVVRSAFQQGAADQISLTAYLASPHYGVPKAYFFLHPDIPLDVGGFAASLVAHRVWANIIRFFEADIKDVVKRLPSVYELLPDEFYFTEQHYLYREAAPGGTVAPVYTLDETYYAHERACLPSALQPMAQEAMAFKKSLGPTLPGETLVLYSDQVRTTDIAEWDPEAWHRRWRLAASEQKADGTVPTWSSTLANTRGTRVGGDHSGLPNLEATFKQLYHFLAKTVPRN
jgi:hypothetical protein